MMEKSSKNYNSIDLFKFIFAILVVMIHTTPLMDFSETASWFFNNTLCNLAVPFFFIVSGFLLFNKVKRLETQVEKQFAVKKYFVHILKMYLIWTVLWLPLKVLGWHTSGGIQSAEIIDYVIAFLLKGTTGDALWYLLALAFSVFIFSVVTKNGETRRKTMLIVSSIVYVIGVLISSYNKLFEGFVLVDWYYNFFGSVDNGLFNGLLFFSIGANVAYLSPKIKTKKTAFLFLISFILLIGETVVVFLLDYNINGVCELFTLPIASTLLFLTVANLDLHRNENIYKKLRDYSTLIYLSHCYVIRLLKMVFAIVKISVPNVLLFIITLVLSLFFAMVVRYFSKEKQIKLFRILY